MPNAIEILGHTDPMRREINKGLMIAWINADLANRAYGDVCRSYVVYDADKTFLYAFPHSMPKDDARELAALVHTAKYMSTGIV
jgi:hypothetical protein